MSGYLYGIREWENGMDEDITKDQNSYQMSFYKFSSYIFFPNYHRLFCKENVAAAWLKNKII